MPKRQVFLALLALFAMVCICCGGGTAAYFYVWCDRHFGPEVASPTGEHVAQLYYEDCEAAGSPGTTEVTIRNRSDRSLIPGMPSGDAVFAVRVDIIPIKLEWAANHSLVISFPFEAYSSGILRQDTMWNGVQIEYIDAGPGG